MKSTGMSSEAVGAKTGRTWEEWIRVLDKDGCRDMSHADLARHISEKYELSGWWSQSVAVGYERAHGKRSVNQKSSGDFAVSVSKTVPVPIDTLYRAWTDGRKRGRWLPGETPEVRTKNENKSMRMKWSDGRSNVNVEFRAKDNGKCAVTVQHEKLSGKRDVEAKRRFWKEALDRLDLMLAGD